MGKPQRQLVLPRPGTCACPFCRSNDAAMSVVTSGGMYVVGYRVRCRECRARGPEAQDEERAWVGWNRRAA